MGTDGTKGAEGEMQVLVEQGETQPQTTTAATSTTTKEGTPETPKPKTYTEDEYKAALKAVSDAKAEAGRTKKQLELTTSKTTTLSNRLADLERQQEEAELRAAEGKPDVVNTLKLRKQIRDTQAEIDRQKDELEQNRSQYEADIAEVKSYKLEKKANEIAKTYGVDSQVLIDLTDGTPEKMEALARILPKKGTQPATTTPATPQVPVPDSGVTLGGSSELTNEQADKMTDAEYFDHPSVKKRYK